MTEEPIAPPPHNKKHDYYNKIILLASTSIVMFFLGEIVFRIYYAYTGDILAANEDEYCMKLNYQRLPTDNTFFYNFTRMGWLDDDPVLGIVFKRNYHEDDYVLAISNASKNTTKNLTYLDAHTFNNKRMNNMQEFLLEKPKNTSIRIALFGDSFTCGEDVPYKFGMGHILKEFIPESEVLNFCVSGTGIDTMYGRYVFKAQEYNPDIVIFNVLVDDLQRPFTCILRTMNLSIVDHTLVIGPRKYPTPRDFYYQYKPPALESYLFKHTRGVYTAHTRYSLDMKRGLALFNTILDDMKQQTKKHNRHFFVSLIQENNPRQISIEYYDKLKHLLSEKNITFFDSAAHFKAYEKQYKQTSFYVDNKENSRGHFNPLGNALFAQGIKNMLENTRILKPTTNYTFANFDNNKPLFLIPENFVEGNKNIRIITPYLTEEENFTPKRAQTATS